MNNDVWDVVIAGGSFAGLSAALSLGRSLRKALVIDNGQPCNKNASNSYNFLTRDGESLDTLKEIAVRDLSKYRTVSVAEDTVSALEKEGSRFRVRTRSGATYRCRKVLFCTGLKDLLPPIPGLDECWGKSIVHCPYCHAFEATGRPVGVLDNGHSGFVMASLLYNWSRNVVLLTNGDPSLEPEQLAILEKFRIPVIGNAITRVVHEKGGLKKVVFENGSSRNVGMLFCNFPVAQACPVPEQAGCELVNGGHIWVDEQHRTTVPGIFAAGDCTTTFRAASVAAGTGTKVGTFINEELSYEDMQ